MKKDKPDLLNRTEDVDIVERFLKSQVNGQGGCVLNVDAGWGLGKTFFMNMLNDRLGDHAVYVNAWETDHADDALLPVLAAVTQGLAALNPDRPSGRLKKVGKSVALSLAMGGIRGGAGILTAGASEGLLRMGSAAAERLMSDQADALFSRFEDAEKSIKAFKDEVAETVKALDQPFTILIDELDRCRPTYAIEMLERIKHLFDIPNVAFVVATDTEQLQHAIKAVYGEGFDAKAYLRRFFSRTYRFDAPDMEAYVKFGFATRNLSLDMLLTAGVSPADRRFADIAKGCGLSFRDVDQCLNQLQNCVSILNDPQFQVDLLFAYIVCHQQGNVYLFEDMASGGSNVELGISQQFGGVSTQFYSGDMQKVMDFLSVNDGNKFLLSWSEMLKELLLNGGPWSKCLLRLDPGNSDRRLVLSALELIGDLKSYDRMNEFPSIVRQAGRLSGGPQASPEPST